MGHYKQCTVLCILSAVRHWPWGMTTSNDVRSLLKDAEYCYFQRHNFSLSLEKEMPFPKATTFFSLKPLKAQESTWVSPVTGKTDSVPGVSVKTHTTVSPSMWHSIKLGHLKNTTNETEEQWHFQEAVHLTCKYESLQNSICKKAKVYEIFSCIKTKML